MDGKNIAIWVVVAAAIVAVGFLILRPATGSTGVVNVDAQEAEELVADGVRTIDVRTPGEYDTARIPGAENVPVQAVEAASASWDPSEPILIYCATGSRSAGVVDYLAEQGFETIYHLDAGVVTWQGEIEKGVATAGTTSDAQDSATAPAEAETQTADETTAIPVMYEFYTDT
jgi:rhodanese-related sulfurtransferase